MGTSSLAFFLPVALLFRSLSIRLRISDLLVLGSFLSTLELLRRKTPRKYVASSFSLHLVVAIQELFGDTYYLHGSGAWLIK